MASLAPGPAPSPGVTILPSVFPPPSSQSTGYGISLPVTKVVTLCLFVASVLGFIVIGLFITFNYYRRRAILRRRLTVTGILHGEADSCPRREIPIHEGFIVANPCGAEQVAFKSTDADKEKELELIKVVIESDSDMDTTRDGRSSGNTSLHTSPSVHRTPGTSDSDHPLEPAYIPHNFSRDPGNSLIGYPTSSDPSSARLPHNR